MSDVGFLVGRTVLEVRDDERVIFEIGERPEPALYADVGACMYKDREGRTGALSAIVGKVVVDTSTAGGTLVLSFADGSRLRSEPDANYEAWQVVGGTPQHLVVCLPGGELAVWDSSHVPSAAEAQETIDRLHELFGWDVRLSEITETGGIIVEPVRGDDDPSAAEPDDR